MFLTTPACFPITFESFIFLSFPILSIVGPFWGRKDIYDERQVELGIFVGATEMVHGKATGFRRPNDRRSDGLTRLNYPSFYHDKLQEKKTV